MSCRLPPQLLAAPRAPLGTCRWCGEAILPGQRRQPGRANWHNECIGEYQLVSMPEIARKAVFHRDGGICAGCGVCCSTCRVRPHMTYWRGWSGGDGYPATSVDFVWQHDWEADHITPLWAVDRSLPVEQLRWLWGLGNLQTLCRDCHREKTSREATERAGRKAA